MASRVQGNLGSITAGRMASAFLREVVDLEEEFEGEGEGNKTGITLEQTLTKSRDRTYTKTVLMGMLRSVNDETTKRILKSRLDEDSADHDADQAWFENLGFEMELLGNGAPKLEAMAPLVAGAMGVLRRLKITGTWGARQATQKKATEGVEKFRAAFLKFEAACRDAERQAESSNTTSKGGKKVGRMSVKTQSKLRAILSRRCTQASTTPSTMKTTWVTTQSRPCCQTGTLGLKRPRMRRTTWWLPSICHQFVWMRTKWMRRIFSHSLEGFDCLPARPALPCPAQLLPVLSPPHRPGSAGIAMDIMESQSTPAGEAQAPTKQRTRTYTSTPTPMRVLAVI